MQRFLNRPPASQTLTERRGLQMHFVRPLTNCLRAAVIRQRRELCRLQGFLNRPSDAQSILNEFSAQFKFFDPLGQCLRATVQGVVTTISTVVLLFFTRSPATIRFFIIPIGIDAIQRRIRRSWSHVSQKVCEVFPVFANLDAAPSVAAVCAMTIPSHALSHGSPTAVFAARTAVQTVTVAVFEIGTVDSEYDGLSHGVRVHLRDVMARRGRAFPRSFTSPLVYQRLAA